MARFSEFSQLGAHDQGIFKQKIQGVRLMHFKPENFIKEVGHNSIMVPLKVLKVMIQGLFWVKITIQNLPLHFGEVKILMVLDPGHWGEGWSMNNCMGAMQPLKTQRIWALGDSHSPHGPQTVGHQTPSRTQNGQKWP
ncbi:hypothetical protein O181_033776 [Austropuccinia psidii MF-1]|uniref:Uncharacterized protein n=1 Tax=Austropuccinia psidii MF-1 TaxID=1389203 RepID=A0A9Q3D530_9BASI|nr:hypothetical protein [Austropuccinia psidii MF-1]